jgi:hypothetical protein
MSGAIHPLPNMPSWRGAQLKRKDNFTFTFTFTLPVFILTTNSPLLWKSKTCHCVRNNQRTLLWATPIHFTSSQPIFLSSILILSSRLFIWSGLAVSRLQWLPTGWTIGGSVLESLHYYVSCIIKNPRPPVSNHTYHTTQLVTGCNENFCMINDHVLLHQYK